MAVPLYIDVHVPWAITDQLRRRGIDVLTAQEDESTESTDEQLLERALHLGRLLFTQDIALNREPRDGNAMDVYSLAWSSATNFAARSVSMSKIWRLSPSCPNRPTGSTWLSMFIFANRCRLWPLSDIARARTTIGWIGPDKYPTGRKTSRELQ